MRSFVLCTALVVMASPAFAQGAGGVRGGLSVDPDQIFLGAHYETGALIERLHFKPNVEVGFGDDITAVTGNFEFVWKFPRFGDWGVYAGGGPAVAWYANGDGDAGGGFNFLVGLESARGLAFEIKLGALDSPDLKFGVGWTFR